MELNKNAHLQVRADLCIQEGRKAQTLENFTFNLIYYIITVKLVG